MKKPSFFNYIKLLRITSWPKNFFVCVPAVFSKHIFSSEYILTIIIGFLTFSIASSTVYVFNDIVDASKDALHPLKKNRPLASGLITRKNAIVLALFLFFIFFGLTTQVPFYYGLIVWGYLIINFLYSIILKQIVIVDLFCIASGFMLRVLGCALLISVVVSNWLVLTTLFLSLFLASMKRRVEIASSPNASEQREVLKDYSLIFIDQISALTGSGVILSYALYTVAERTVTVFGTENLVFTTMFVIFGIFRYMYLVYKKDKGENVIEVLMTDIPMIINLFFYIISILYIIYLRNSALLQ